MVQFGGGRLCSCATSQRGAAQVSAEPLCALGDYMDKKHILEEIRRTAKENGSRGTDHGCAAAWFAAGHRINGGVYTGSAGWPRLSESQLRDGRYLDFTVDYRDIMGDVLLNHLGNPNLAEMLPGHVYAPLGLVG